MAGKVHCAKFRQLFHYVVCRPRPKLEIGTNLEWLEVHCAKFRQLFHNVVCRPRPKLEIGTNLEWLGSALCQISPAIPLCSM